MRKATRANLEAVTEALRERSTLLADAKAEFDRGRYDSAIASAEIAVNVSDDAIRRARGLPRFVRRTKGLTDKKLEQLKGDARDDRDVYKIIKGMRR